MSQKTLPPRLIKRKNVVDELLQLALHLQGRLKQLRQQNDGKIIAASGWTSIFIYPGYEFSIVDGLINKLSFTKIDIIMLVSALSTREYILAAYNAAIEENYRFFSFGDAMFIKPPRKKGIQINDSSNYLRTYKNM